MSINLVVPEMGESVIEATVSRWMKNVGDPVKPGDPVLELETDKVNLEVAATTSGTLSSVLAPAGAVVHVGDVLGIIGGELASPPETKPDTSGIAAVLLPVDEQATPRTLAVPEAPKVSPVAMRIAKTTGVDPAQVAGSGPGGRVMRKDIEQAIPQPAPVAQPLISETPISQVNSTSSRQETRIRMSRRRQTIARRLVEAQSTAAMLTTFNEVDMTAVMDLRKRRRESFKERFGVDLGFMSFFVKASIGALIDFPNVNAEIQGDEIVRKSYYDIGIAVGAREGLVVPVLRDANHMSFADIERAIRSFSKKAEENSFSLEELRGGTFTITNGGVFGSLLSTPILNPPQVGILGMHKIQERPMALNGSVVIRPMMYLALTYDHRMIDGREAVLFLVRIKELIEDPSLLLFVD